MRLAVRVMAMAAGLVLLLLAWWGWQQGGLGLMQLGMAIC
ncbi:hypothetical protein VO64_5056 [Pseudomonas synxantha]|uniref:Uncharacterized protein n=1 Tax=Pseudomonas synxantha TaxID=47883 RepID=A0AAU8U484_9PSED|nr:hypothetical protein VO64_5056 [Pseudomonas synxantha]